MRSLTGTWALTRLALRRDRIKLPVWFIAIVGTLAAALPALSSLYDTPEKQLVYATTTGASTITRAFGGPIDGPHFGEVVLMENYITLAVMISFMCTLSVVRHTRQNEETGRAEMIGSAVVGRHASLTAALIVTSGTALAIGVSIALVLIINDLPASGSWAMGMSITGIGLVFAAAAAITAQIADSARTANSLAAMAIGIGFLLRAAGDSLGSFSMQTLSVTSLWPSWLSPFGWGQQIRPFTDGNWWVITLFPTAFLALTSVAFILASHRDVGLGMITTRRGPATANAALLSPLGLAWRLQKGILIGWVITIIVIGILFGFMGKEFGKLLESNEQMGEIMSALGGKGDINDIFLGSAFSLAAIAITGYALQALLRMRTEEASGQLEPILATSVSREGWLFSHVTCVLGGVMALSLVMGLSTGVSYVIASGESWNELWRMLGGALAQTPAILALAGLVIAFFGLLPRLTAAIAWGAFTVCVLMGQVGALLKLPQMLLNASPFSHLMPVPAVAINWPPVIILSLTGLVLGTAGVYFFCKRDIITA